MTRRTFFATLAAVVAGPRMAASSVPSVGGFQTMLLMERSTYPAWKAHVPASTGEFTRAHAQMLFGRCQRPDYVNKAMWEDGRPR